MKNDFASTTRKELIETIHRHEKKVDELNRIVSELNDIILGYQGETDELKAEIERLSKPKITPCPYPDEYPPSLKESGYIIAMKLLQSHLKLDDREMAACAEFTKPEIIRCVFDKG